MSDQPIRNLEIFSKIHTIFKNPDTNLPIDFEIKNNQLTRVSSENKEYEIDSNSIPLLFSQNHWNGSDVTFDMKKFYEQYPFPNYDNIDSKFTLREKAEKAVVFNLLDKQIPAGSRILEVGCGTGQLTNFLALTPGRQVVGSDLCLNSLRLANKFANKNSINQAAFVQMNLFKPAFNDESFDLVISNGVLHHTSRPYDAFCSIAKLVKKNGYILIGLYNSYGRIPTHIRRFIFKITNNRFKNIDFKMRQKNVDDIKKNVWFMDQYKNPHESCHTMDEVHGWFDKNNFEFIHSIPKSLAAEPFNANEKLFLKEPRGNRIENIFAQLGMLFNEAKEGGLFIMIGRKK